MENNIDKALLNLANDIDELREDVIKTNKTMCILAAILTISCMSFLIVMLKGIHNVNDSYLTLEATRLEIENEINDKDNSSNEDTTANYVEKACTNIVDNESFKEHYNGDNKVIPYDVSNYSIVEKNNTLSINSIDIVVNNSTECNELTNNEYAVTHTSGAGTKYVVVELGIKNTGSDIYYMSRNMRLIDNLGRRYYIVNKCYEYVENSLVGVGIGSDMERIGRVVYNVPDDASSYIIEVIDDKDMTKYGLKLK